MGQWLIQGVEAQHLQCTLRRPVAHGSPVPGQVEVHGFSFN
jgi:hypothetical protein